MKRVLIFMMLGMPFGAAAGCQVGECWRYAWNSRFCPERNVIVAQPCVVTDPCCDPCFDPCNPCAIGAPMAVPGPIVVQ